MSNGAGKGDRYRPVDPKRWSEAWDRIFGKKRGCSVNHEHTKECKKKKSEGD